MGCTLRLPVPSLDSPVFFLSFFPLWLLSTEVTPESVWPPHLPGLSPKTMFLGIAQEEKGDEEGERGGRAEGRWPHPSSHGHPEQTTKLCEVL